MKLSRITRALGLFTLLASSLLQLQATESPCFDDLPDDALLAIMHFLPDRDIGAMAMTSRAPSEVSRTALLSLISEMTLNRGGKENTQRLQSLPEARVQDVLRQMAENERYVAVSMNSSLCPLMPETLKLADLNDWRGQLPLVRDLYAAAFGQDLPDAHEDLALQQVLALIDTRVYVQKDSIAMSFTQFAAHHANNLVARLKSQCESCPFINFLHGDIDATLLAPQAYTIVLSDADVLHAETKQKLEQILATQTEELSHHVLLSMGYNPRLLQAGALHLYSDRLPSDLRQMTVTNPAANVTTIGNGFLAKNFQAPNNPVLTKLRFAGFHNLNSIGSSFLSNCDSLKSVDLSAFKNVSQIKDWFLYGCTGLTSVDLSAFKNVTQIGHWFLSNCDSLTSVDLSAFKSVTQIGDWLLSGCRGLTSVDLSHLSNATSIGGSLFELCTALTPEAQKHVRDFCKKRGMKWRPS